MRQRPLGQDRPLPRPERPGDLLPAEQPLAMPDQCYAATPDLPPLTVRDRLTLPRIIILVAVLAATALFAVNLHEVLAAPSMTILQALFLVLSTVVFSWVAFGSALAVAGFLVLSTGRSGDSLPMPDTWTPPQTRTALLFPVYHEDMAPVATTIEHLSTELSGHGVARAFDIFVLSDSRTPEARSRERRAITALRRAVGGQIAVFARWRQENVGRKAGNIREWIERFGDGYDHFIVFDADSTMSAEAVLRLVTAMEAHPAVGLIQTVPRLEPGGTLLTQLAAATSRLNGRIAAAGLALWQAESGNYWGHNAIVRTRAFAAHAGLAPLDGNPPFGGTILSHDFVEAALLRRAGWQVHLAPSVGGSAEGSPPRLGELLVRDRRWAQGNLQHLRLLGTHGLPWVSRFHLASGAFAYLASAIWASTLLIGVVLAIQARFHAPAYFGTEPTLFPLWPRFNPEAALPLLGWTMGVVFLPKILGIAYALERHVHDSGPRLRLITGALIETFYSALVAPVLMAAQTVAVTEILARRDSGWRAQSRQGDTLSFRAALSNHAGKVTAGILLLATAWLAAPPLTLWMSPIIAGLLAAPVTDWITSRPPGSTLKRLLAAPWPGDDAKQNHEQQVAGWQARLDGGEAEEFEHADSHVARG